MPRQDGGGRRPPRDRRRLSATLAAAVLLFAGVFALRIAIDDPSQTVTLLFALPITLVAVELGVRWGLAAAALGLSLFGIWDLAWAASGEHSALEYLGRGGAFFLLGGMVGGLADRLRRVSLESDRYFELSTDLLCTAGFDGYFKRLNPAWEGALGWTLEELRARPFIEFVHRDDRERTEAEAARLADAGERITNFDNRYRCKDGTYRTLLWSASAVAQEELLYAAAKDITERKEAEQKVEAARQDAERANHAKSEFLSRMSHELRTPLNAIIGFAQLLELEELESKQREGVEQILKGGRHLLELINEVLDISRIEAGTMSISIEPVHLGSVLAEASSLIGPLAEEAEVTLKADPAELEGAYVLADQQRLKQVLLNLLSNAVKYNRPGGEVRVGRKQPATDRVQITVEDTGWGMSEEQLEKLFSPFDRAGAESTQIEGTGLGLALSKRLIELMGGTIEAESNPGTGTTMRVELERAESPEGWEPSTGDGAARLDGGARRERRTVLYVEDNLSNVRLVERVIERLPEVRLIPAMHGGLGLELARQHHPDLVLLDLHLPDLRGEEVLERLREDPATATIPVVVVSADATAGQIERLRNAGAADYLTKPLDVERLLEVVAAASQ